MHNLLPVCCRHSISCWFVLNAQQVHDRSNSVEFVLCWCKHVLAVITGRRYNERWAIGPIIHRSTVNRLSCQSYISCPTWLWSTDSQAKYWYGHQPLPARAINIMSMTAASICIIYTLDKMLHHKRGGLFSPSGGRWYILGPQLHHFPP